MKLLSLGLCVVLLAGTVPADAQRRRHHRNRTQPVHSGKNPKQLRSALSNVREKKAALRRQYVQTKHQANVVVQDIHVVDARLERIQDDLSETASNLTSGEREQSLLGKELGAATKRVGVLRVQVAKRLRYMYTHEGESVISAFAGVRSVEDLESTKVLLESVSKRDHEIFSEYRSLRTEIGTKKRRQDSLVVHIADLKHRQQSQQNELKYTRGVKAQTLGALRNKQEQLRAMIAQYDADERSIASEIQAFEAMAKRSSHRSGGHTDVVFTGRFARPARGPITSGFGMRYHPVLHYTRLHAGIDFGAPYGSPIVAAGDGIVIAARYSQSFGNMVVIDHGNGVSTLYAHGSRLYVSAGQRVHRGQRIAAVGATGLATGPHLHFEVRINGRPVNPIGRL